MNQRPSDVGGVVKAEGVDVVASPPPVETGRETGTAEMVAEKIYRN